MICPVVPQGFIDEQWGLLTALGLGFFFGFSLERAGFGNARVLAAQFYGNDMSVFKVMFTAVLVAMVGLYAFDAFGLVDLSLLWINPTFIWAQLAGGFFVGVGFAVSGLCPGTAVVATASGRIDGLLTVIGTFAGTFIFALLMDWLPSMETLYSAGFQGRSLLPDLLGIPAPWLALAVLAVALGGFIGAEKLEKIFQQRHGRVELTAAGGADGKYVLVAGLAVVTLVAGLFPDRSAEPTSLAAESFEPRVLASALIAGDPELLVIDRRPESAEGIIPGAQRAELEGDLGTLLSFAAPGSTVLFVDADGKIPQLDGGLPPELHYRYLRGGYAAWHEEVLTPREPLNGQMDEIEAVRRHNQIAAFFSGVEAQPTVSAPLPPAPTGGAKKKKADGGC